jgi:hypothetical protein
VKRFWTWPKRQDEIPVKAPAQGEVCLLPLLRDRLHSCGVEGVADAHLEDEGRRIMAWERRLAITTEVCELDQGRLHAHIVSWLPNSRVPGGADKLDGCVFGDGATIDRAANQVADNWLQAVGAPIMSLLAAGPVLAADHFEGHEEWGVPGGHGFVGPFRVCGASQEIDLHLLAKGDAFRFDGYPRDGQTHLVKATLLGKDGRWTRYLEIDGHTSVHSDEDWLLGVSAPQSPVICVRFAVFWRGADEAHGDNCLRHSVTTPPQQPGQSTPAPCPAPFRLLGLRDKIEAAVKIFMSHPSAGQDELLSLLEAAGFAPEEAWRIFQFVPMAFCHVVLKHDGISFPSGYISMSFSRGPQVQRELKDEPIFQAGMEHAEELVASGYSRAQLLPVFRISAEYATLSKLKNPDGSFRGLCLVKPILFDYEEGA